MFILAKWPFRSCTLDLVSESLLYSSLIIDAAFQEGLDVKVTSTLPSIIFVIYTEAVLTPSISIEFKLFRTTSYPSSSGFERGAFPL